MAATPVDTISLGEDQLGEEEGQPPGLEGEGFELGDEPTEILHDEEEEEIATIDLTTTYFKYAKPRSAFGKQTQFLEDRARIHCSLRANRERYFPQFQQMTRLSKQVDTMPHLRCLDTNTGRAEFRNFSVLHTEGGWPKDVNLRDPESVEKARRKFQKEDSFLDVMPSLTREAEALVKHNNALGLCEPLNKNLYTPKRDSKPWASVISVYKCPTIMRRPVSKIYFCPDDSGRMVCAYCPYEFDPSFREHSCEAFFWEMENPTRPEGLVRAAAQIVDVRYHPYHTNLICGALFTGQVCTWDTRVGPNPQMISGFEQSHADVCTNAIWTATEENMEENQDFFSCGLDGQVIWWDSRNLAERLNTIKAKDNPPFSAMEYQNSLPSKFLVGTQFGEVLSYKTQEGNNKAQLATLYKAHRGPITALQRNPLAFDYFMSCGGYDLRIFAEECKDSGIMWTSPSDTLYSHGQWLKSRPCSIVAGRIDGALEFWDLQILGASSILTTKICEEALSFVCPCEDGENIACGTVNGEIRIVQLCPFMTKMEDEEKEALKASFAREARRENSLAHKLRKQKKAAAKAAKKKGAAGAVSDGEEGDEDEGPETDKEGEQKEGEKEGGKRVPDPFSNPDILADKDFFEMLAEEKKRQGVNAFPDKKQQAEEHSNALIDGRMQEKKRAVIKAHKKSDSELGATQIYEVNEEVLRKANLIIEGEMGWDEEEDEEEDDEEEEEGDEQEEDEDGEEPALSDVNEEPPLSASASGRPSEAAGSAKPSEAPSIRQSMAPSARPSMAAAAPSARPSVANAPSVRQSMAPSARPSMANTSTNSRTGQPDAPPEE